MNEHLHNPVGGRTGIADAFSGVLRQPSFSSFVPYIGLVLMVATAVVLALAEFGVNRAVLVIAGVIVINIVAENVLSPMMMGRGLNIAPTIVFDNFPETRWLASLIGVADVDTSAVNGATQAPLLRVGRSDIRHE